MFENKVSYSYMDLFTKSHWVVYEGGLTFYGCIICKNGLNEMKEHV